MSDPHSLHAETHTPRVSIVLPVHNGEAFVAEALDSILAQDFADFELICVDDGSSDTSPAILASYAARDPRVRVLTNTPNRGLPGALNRGFADAHGSLHSWTSDDNILRPNMLSRLVATLEAHQDVDIVHSAFSVIDEKGAFLYRVSVGPVEDILFSNNVGASFLYRARVTEALKGYDEGLFGVEDYDFWLRAARQFRFMPLEDDLYLYRRHGGSLTDMRAKSIQRMCADVILRETATMEAGTRKADILLTTAMKSRLELRLDLFASAWRADSRLVLSRIFRIARWCLSVTRQRLFN